MKYRSYHLLLAGIFSLLTTGAMAEKTSDKPYWQDVQVVSVNKEYPRTSQLPGTLISFQESVLTEGSVILAGRSL